MSLPQQDFTFDDTELVSSNSFSISHFNNAFQRIYGYLNQVRGEVYGTSLTLGDTNDTTGNLKGHLYFKKGSDTVADIDLSPSLSLSSNTISVTVGGKTATQDISGIKSNNAILADKATSVKANLTLSNTSDGSASGTTYNGSTAVTIGYKSILSTAQQNAVNSGITSSKVSQYDGYNDKINNRLFFIKQSSTPIINSDEAHLGRLRTGWTNSEYYEGVEVSDKFFLAFVNHGMPPDLSYKGRNWNNLAPFIYLLGI